MAIQRYTEGHPAEEIAHFLGVSARSVWRWLAAFWSQGSNGLAARPMSGRRPKLTDEQEQAVLAWLRENPTDHGFPNELWTAGRVAQRIHREWGITFNRRYLSGWLRDRAITPQLPQRVPRERDPDQIARWLATEWPRIKKRCAGCTPIWSRSMRVACCWHPCGGVRWPRGVRRRS
jgi:transposase